MSGIVVCSMPNCQTSAGCQCGRVEYQTMVDRVNRMTDDGRLPGEPKRAPMTSVPVPAAMPSLRLGALVAHLGTVESALRTAAENIDRLTARALAAEAALAGERERCAKVAVAEVERSAAILRPSELAVTVAAAIRAQGV